MTIPSPLLQWPGAVPADPPDQGVAAHYGDPYREQRHLSEHVGLVDRSHRDVVRVGGPDRLSWLHSLLTQHVAQLPAWRGTEALLLTPHGHVESHLLLADDGTATWLDLEPGTGAVLLEFLERMRFLLRVEPALVTHDWALLSLVGPAAEAVLGRGVTLPPEPYAVAPLPDGGWARRMPWPGAGGADLLVPRALLAKVAAALRKAGATPAGVEAYEALRVAQRQPRLGRDTDHKTIPHEVGWLRSAVHLDKGCYRGQETVARVHNLGRPPRRLALLHLDGSVDRLPPAGASVTSADGRVVGVVGTAVRHHELGPIALAVVKRTIPDDQPLLAGGVAAAVDPEAEPLEPLPRAGRPLTGAVRRAVPPRPGARPS